MKRSFILVVFNFLFSLGLLSITVGSNLTVSRQSDRVTFPEADSNPTTTNLSPNIMQGFVVMEGGFSLETAQTTCSYDAFFPIRDTGVLNNGTLFVITTLRFDNDKILVGPGRVDIAGAQGVSFGKNDSVFESPLSWTCASSASIELNAEVDLLDTWSFRGPSFSINGNGHTLTLTSAGSIVLDSNTTLTLRNLIVRGVRSSNIRSSFDSGKLVLENVRWVMEGDFSFTMGALSFKNNVDMQGSFTFAYQSSQTSTIESQSKLTLESGFTFSYDPVRLASKNLLEFADITSALVLDGGTFHTTTTGIRLAHGKLIGLNRPRLESESADGIDLGSGVAEDDFLVELKEGALLRFSGTVLNYRNTRPDFFVLVNNRAKLRIDSGRLSIFEDLIVNDGFFEFGDGSTLARSQDKQFNVSTVLDGNVTVTVF